MRPPPLREPGEMFRQLKRMRAEGLPCTRQSHCWFESDQHLTFCILGLRVDLDCQNGHDQGQTNTRNSSHKLSKPNHLHSAHCQNTNGHYNKETLAKSRPQLVAAGVSPDLEPGILPGG